MKRNTLFNKKEIKDNEKQIKDYRLKKPESKRYLKRDIIPLKQYPTVNMD